METDTDIFNLDEEKMIILITGASHTGKTLLAQKMLEKYKYPYGYSKTFRLFYNSLGKSGYYGALVRRSCAEIDSYQIPD